MTGHVAAPPTVPDEQGQTGTSERMGDSHEATPLLPRLHPLSKDQGHQSSFSSPSNPLKADTTHPRFRHVPVLACLIVLMTEVGFYTNYIPTLRMIEAMRCVEYYQVNDVSIIHTFGRQIPEQLCKSSVIQEEVATTMGYVTFVRMIGSLVGTVWLGWMADKYSRKWALFFNKLGWVNIGAAHLFIYLTFPLLPVWTMYVSCGFAFFAGNFDVGLAIVFSSISDVVPSNTQRGTLFFLISSMLSVAQAVCPPLGGLLLNLDGQGGTAWVPFSIGILAAIITTGLIAFAFPETLEKAPLWSSTSAEEATRSSSMAPQPVAPSTRHSSLSSLLKRLTRKFFPKKSLQVKESGQGIGVFSILLLNTAMFFVTLGIKGLDLSTLPIYATTKLGWMFTQTAFTMSLQAIVNIINFMFVSPWMMRRGGRTIGPSSTTLRIMLGSGVLLIAGAILIGFSATSWTFLIGVTLYNSGQGLPTALQAYLTTIIDRSKIGRVLSVMSLAQTTGKMIQSVLFPKLFSLGLRTHVDVLVGLPFFAGAGMFGVSMLCIGAYMLFFSGHGGKKTGV